MRNLAFQWQRELKEKFDEKFEVIKGTDLRVQYGINQFLERSQIITSLDLAKRDDVLPGLRQVHWDLVIVDEAHRMSWTPPSRKTARSAPPESPHTSQTGGALEHAQEMAAHESPRTTKLYDRTKERLTQDEVERIRF